MNFDGVSDFDMAVALICRFLCNDEAQLVASLQGNHEKLEKSRTKFVNKGSST